MGPGLNTDSSFHQIDTPLGVFQLEIGPKGIRNFWPKDEQINPQNSVSNPKISEIKSALEAFFSGNHIALDSIAVDPEGTTFQKLTWEALRTIPPGTTFSYSKLAEQIDKPGSFRAVARACATNPVALFIPCHRVIAKDGSLSGFRAGVDMKRELLKLEGCANFL